MERTKDSLFGWLVKNTIAVIYGSQFIIIHWFSSMVVNSLELLSWDDKLVCNESRLIC